MRHFTSFAHGEISLIAHKEHNSLIVMVESAETPNIYQTEETPGPANIFDNFHTRWNETLEVNGGINLAVISYADSFVRSQSSEAVLQRIESDVTKLCRKMEIAPEDTGIILVSSAISKGSFNNVYDFMNVLVANNSDKRSRKLMPLRLPFDSKFAWTNSIPAWLWTITGNIKDDAAGINLMGFVVRAATVVMYRQTEGSIYKEMAAYHSGKFGKLKLVSNLKEFETMMRDLRRKKFVSIDSEADNLNRVYGNTLLALQFACVNKRTDIPTMWVMPIEHSETPWNAKQIRYIKKVFKQYFEFECKRQTHIYQNQKYDVHQLMSYLKIRWYAAKFYDTMAGAFSLEENQKFIKVLREHSYSLEILERSAEYERPPELVIKKSDRGKMATFSLQEIAEYGIIDVLTPIYLMFEQVAIAKHRGYPNFFTFITRQMGPMVYAMTEMEHNGIPIDFEYLKSLASPIGPLAERIRNVAAELSGSKAAIKANKTLLSNASFQKEGLFGKAIEPQLWSIRKKEHLQMLFFNILGLEPTGFLKDGTGKIDKLFQKVYRYTDEVAKFTQYSKLNKLKSAFADAIYKYLLNSPDMRLDKRLRPVFGYQDVVSGRSCFIAGTRVTTESGKLISIETLKVGDKVWSYNLQSKQFQVKPITAVTQTDNCEVMQLEIKYLSNQGAYATTTVTCTPDHLFLTNDGWVEAQNLKNETSLIHIGTTWVARLKGKKKLQSKKTVYDIEVADNHNFLVEDLIVHNSTIKPSSQQLPQHGKDAKTIKTQFRTAKRRVIVKSDFAGHEVRVSGNITLDPAICGAVDRVNEKFMAYRLASTSEEIEKAKGELSDLHCVTGDTLISTDEGLIRIDAFVRNDRRINNLKSVNVDTHVGMRKATTAIYQGKKAVVRYTLEDGRELKVTPDHKVLVFDGLRLIWKPIGKVKSTETLMIRSNELQVSKSKLNENVAFILGAYVAEGSCVEHRRVTFTNADLGYLKRIEDKISKEFGISGELILVCEAGSRTTIKGKSTIRNQNVYALRYGRELVEILSNLDVYIDGTVKGKTASFHQHVPNSVFQSNTRAKLAFFGAYVDGDGMVDGCRIDCVSVSKRLVSDLQIMLSSIGCHSSVVKRRSGEYILHLAIEAASNIQAALRPYSQKAALVKFEQKEESYKIRGVQFSKIVDNLRSRKLSQGWGKTIFQHENGEAITSKLQMSKLQLGNMGKVARDKMNEKWSQYPYLMELCKDVLPSTHDDVRHIFDNNLIPLRIIKKKQLGKKKVYDLSVDMKDGAEPCFIANGIVVHNCENYFTFFNVRISKKDPRRQDAKTAVFAVTYDSKAKAIGEKMRSERLYDLEDQFERAKNPQKDEDKRTEGQLKAISKEIAYLKTSEAEEEYFEKASDLLDVLQKKWGILTKFKAREQKKAKKYNVVFGPHGRPRHLWGYFHFDKFVGFAMDRRVFNSEGQGYASDYGYLGIYLAKKAIWDLFQSRGIEIDVMQTNAVHDSSFVDTAFQYLPIMIYIQEHAMISQTAKYYKQHFGITNKTQYGFDLEVGICEADMETWDGRYEGGVKIIEKYGPEAGMTKDEIDDALHDWKIISKLRLHELHNTPNEMTLYRKEVWDSVVPRLRMFKDHFKNSKQKHAA